VAVSSTVVPANAPPIFCNTTAPVADLAIISLPPARIRQPLSLLAIGIIAMPIALLLFVSWKIPILEIILHIIPTQLPPRFQSMLLSAVRRSMIIPVGVKQNFFCG